MVTVKCKLIGVSRSWIKASEDNAAAAFIRNPLRVFATIVDDNMI
jgi:hypothetical protein